MVNNDFLQEIEQKKALHALEVARLELADAKSKLEELREAQSDAWQEVNRLQAEYDSLVEAKDQAWEKYNADQLAMKEDIAKKIASIKECNRLELEFRNLATSTPEYAEVYNSTANYLVKLSKEMQVEYDELIAKKRAVPRPDNIMAQATLQNLKLARLKHSELLEKFHMAKNVYTLKQNEYERLNQRCRELSGQNQHANTNTTKTYTSRPKQLENDEKMTILEKTAIPEEYWDEAKVEKRADGLIDIYYARSLGDGHGHVVMDSNYQVQFHRSPVVDSTDGADGSSAKPGTVIVYRH